MNCSTMRTVLIIFLFFTTVAPWALPSAFPKEKFYEEFIEGLRSDKELTALNFVFFFLDKDNDGYLEKGELDQVTVRLGVLNNEFVHQ